MRHIGNGRMIHSKDKELKIWRELIAWKAKEAGCTISSEPIFMVLNFRVKKPKSVKRLFPTVPPDLDKYIRGVNDALTGIAYIDDSQVISIRATKGYAEIPGVDIEISNLSDGF